MVEFRDFKNSLMFRTGCVVMTSAVSFMATCGDARQAMAAWPAFPAGRKSASVDGSKSPKGFTASIRKLMSEAKQHEERGDLDRAIAVAERATVIAEKTADLNKSAPDILPDATSRYVSELKRKKAESQSRKWQIGRREPKRAAPVEQRPVEQETLVQHSVAEPDTIFDSMLELNDDQVASKRVVVPRSEPATPESSNIEPTLNELNATESRTPESIATERAVANQTRRESVALEPVTAEVTVAEAPEPKQKKPELNLRRRFMARLRPRFIGERASERHAAPLSVTAVTTEDSRLKETQEEPVTQSLPHDQESTSLPVLNSDVVNFTSPPKTIHDIFEEDESSETSLSEPPLSEPEVLQSLTESPQEVPRAQSAAGEAEVRPAQLQAEDTVVSSVAQAIEDELAVTRSARVSKRIKLRPRFDSTEGLDLADAFPEDSPAISTGPTIESWSDMANNLQTDAPLPLDPMVESNHIRPVAASDDSDTTGFASVSPEPATSTGNDKPRPHDQRKAAKLADDHPWYDNTEDEFPTRQVNELKQRLESAVSLQPGDLRKSATIDLLSERLVDESDEESPFEEAASDAEVVAPDARTLFESVSEPATRDSHRHSQSRNTIVGRTSMVRWRAASEDLAGSSSKKRGTSKSADLPSDLRQSLREGSDLEALSETGSRSLFSLPTVKLRIKSDTMRNASKNEPLAPPMASPLTPRAEVRGSLWDNATAPTIEGYSGSIAGRPIANEAAKDESLSAPLPPGEPSVEQTSFDSPGALYGRFGQANSSHVSHSRTASIGHLDAIAPPEPSTESGRHVVSVKNASLKSRPETTVDQATASSQALLLNGPIERLAFVLGISISTASTIVGMIGMTMVIGGLWMVRALVRSSLK